MDGDVYGDVIVDIANHVYAITDTGWVYCFDGVDGTELWHATGFQGFHSSPIIDTSGRLIVCSTTGQMIAFSSE